VVLDTKNRILFFVFKKGVLLPCCEVRAVQQFNQRTVAEAFVVLNRRTALYKAKPAVYICRRARVLGVVQYAKTQRSFIMKNKKIFAGIAVLALLFGLVFAGCASAPPTAFETAESLEGTAWMQGSILVMNDKTSGVLTDRDDKEIAFTYTAVYDAQNRTFTGTITLEDGRVAEFSAKNAGIFGWTLTANVLESSSFNYQTPEQLEGVYRQKRMKVEIVEKYGSEYLDLYWKVLKRNSDNIMITYKSPYGLYQTTGRAAEMVRTAYKLHSKDGVTITLLSFNTTGLQYAGVEGVGTFNISINGDNVTISNGTGAGAEFNGVYTVQ